MACGLVRLQVLDLALDGGLVQWLISRRSPVLTAAPSAPLSASLVGNGQHIVLLWSERYCAP